MFDLATYTISRKKDFSWLCVWPFEMRELKLLLHKYFQRTGFSQCYVQMENNFWGDGYYPPSVNTLPIKKIINNTIGIIDGVELINNELEGIIDLKIYIPQKQVDDIDLLTNCMQNGNHGLFLEKWGGNSLYIHDGSKFYFDYIETTDNGRDVLGDIISLYNKVIDKNNSIWTRLNLLQDDRSGLIIISPEGNIIFKEIDASIQKYEKTEELFGK